MKLIILLHCTVHQVHLHITIWRNICYKFASFDWSNHANQSHRSHVISAVCFA